MKSIEEKCLNFVTRYYSPNKLDTQKAYQQFLSQQCIDVPRKRNFAIIYKIAAAIVVIVTIGLAVYQQSTSPKWIELAAGKVKTEYLLPDSTLITLAPYASICYNKKAYREDSVRLVKISGKVFFDVKRNAHRPFEVTSTLARITVLGTEFEVNSNSEETTVYVTTGKVSFTSLFNKNGLILTQGMEAVLEKNQTTPQLVKASSLNRIAWKTGVFQFDNTPISDVLSHLSLFYNTHFSTTATDKRVSGKFIANDKKEIIEILEHVLQIDIRETN